MNRNTKRYPQEEIISLKKRGKRLRGGYLLAKLKNWKSSGSKPEIDRPKTIKPKPLTTKRKTEPKQKVEAKGRAIPKSIEVKPVKAKKTIVKQPKQKVEAKGRAIPKSIEVKPIEKKVRKPRQQSVNKVVVEKIKQAEQKSVETEKKYYSTQDLGRGRYSVSYSGNRKNRDGSLQPEFHIFSTKKAQKDYVKKLEKEGYLYSSGLERQSEKDLRNYGFDVNHVLDMYKLWREKYDIATTGQWKKYFYEQFYFFPNHFMQMIDKTEEEIIETLKNEDKSIINIADLKRFVQRLRFFLSEYREERGQLFDNFNPNTEQELQAIAKDIPAFGDDYKILPNIDMNMLKLAYKKWEQMSKNRIGIGKKDYTIWNKWKDELIKIYTTKEIEKIDSILFDSNYDTEHLTNLLNSVVNNKNIKKYGSLKKKQGEWAYDIVNGIIDVSYMKRKSPFLDDNFNPNTEQELQAIAKDIPAFGDDVNEEKFDLDGKYNLPEVVQKRDNMEVASVKDIKTMRFKALTLPSKYRQLLGKVPANFRMLLWGSPGHGKSSLALTIANDIGKFVKTLYVSAEESLQSATLSSRIKRFKANARNLMFNDSNNPDILDKIIMTQNPKFVVIDSVNVMIGKTEAIINLMLKYPEVGFIIIAQATKDKKKYAGLGSLAHAVDIVVNVRSGMAVAEKNRYAQLGSMPVKGIKI